MKDIILQKAAVLEAMMRAVSKVAPIEGISVGRYDDRKTWRIDFKKSATPGEINVGNAVLAAFDVDAVPEVKSELEQLKDRVAALETKAGI